MRTNPRTRDIGLHVHDWESAHKFLRGRPSRRLANNTEVYALGDESIGVRLHRTTIVRYLPDGRIALDSGGWRTVTTKQRINELLPPGLRVSQVRREWFLNDTPFEDGMVVDTGWERHAHRYTGNPGDWLGKFADGVEEVLYQFGGESGTISLPDGGGWYGLELNVTQHEVTDFARQADIRVTRKDLARWAFPLHVIIHEDSDGHVRVELYDTAKDAEEAWEGLEASLSDDSDGED